MPDFNKEGRWPRCPVCSVFEWCRSMDSGGDDKPAECDRDVDGRRKAAKRVLGLPIIEGAPDAD